MIDFQDSFWSKEYLLYDSRKLIRGKDTLFFALTGRYQDGHSFLESLYKKGVRNFVVRHIPKNAQLNMPNASFQEVEIPLLCMQQLATFHRKQYSIPVIGITGSNGKTIVKEWLYDLLSSDFRIVKSPKSYNSQIGVPLSVWEMNQYHNLAIFEAGISRKSEMVILEKIIQPTLGIFTNIGPAHDEGFASREEKIREKLQLFKNAKTLIYNTDNPLLEKEIKQLKYVELYGWGKSEGAVWRYSQTTLENNTSEITFSNTHTGDVNTFLLPFSDAASIENALHCIATMFYLGKSAAFIQKQLSRLHNLPMRLELKEGQNSCQIIDDTYSNDVLSLKVALDFLEQHRQQKKATIVLSDLQETGQLNEKIYPQIAQWFTERKIDKLWGVGEAISEFQTYFKVPQKRFFKDTEEVIQHIENERSSHNEIILIKGARSFQFEKIVNRLQRKLHGTRLEINLESITYNLKFFKSFLKPSTKVMVMVKAFGYGSGSYQIADVLQYQGVDYLAVAYADEGAKLREKGIRLPIMVMNPLPETYDSLLQHRLEPEIYSLNHLKSFIGFIQQKEVKKPINIHLKLETGMHRLGFLEEDLDELLQLLSEHSQLKVATVFSHLAAADDAEEKAFTLQQIELFNTLSSQLKSKLPYPFTRHILNSAGIARYPQAQFDMVRLGVGLYGVEVNNLYQDALQTVGTLKTTISQIKTIQKGGTVGYGRFGIAPKTTKVATIAIGYADGYDRRFSKGVGKVWINGFLVPVIGNVCMDMTMIDVTDIPAKEGDEVVIFGKERSVTEVAQSIGTIPYEILTNIKNRVRRVFYIA